MASESQLRNKIEWVFQDGFEEWVSPDKERELFDLVISYIKQFTFGLFETREWKIGEDKPAGDAIQDPALIGAKILPVIFLDDVPMQMLRAGITFDPATGTINANSIGGFSAGSFFTILFFKKP